VISDYILVIKESPMQTQPAFDTHYYDTHTVVRFVVTHLDTKGNRTLLNPQQGRYTHATKEEAEQELANIKANNCEESIWELFGDPAAMEVRPCQCWNNHHDPVGIWFN
jgi:hypothetical protein